MGSTMAMEQQRRGSTNRRNLLTGQSAGQSLISALPGSVIYAQGDPANAAFYVEKGRLKITSVAENGKETVIAIRREGEFFGTRCLVGKRKGTVTALTDSVLIRITRSALIHLLREQPDFAVMFSSYLICQSILNQEILMDYLTHSAEKRLARALLRLAFDGDSDEPNIISPPISQGVLANMIGTTRSRVSFFMNKFKRQGLIEYDREGRVTIRNSLRRTVLER